MDERTHRNQAEHNAYRYSASHCRGDICSSVSVCFCHSEFGIRIAFSRDFFLKHCKTVQVTTTVRVSPRDRVDVPPPLNICMPRHMLCAVCMMLCCAGTMSVGVHAA